MDHRAELLRTQAVHACLGAMGAAEGRIYGPGPSEWSGTVLNDESTLTSSTNWTDEAGICRYDVVVRVDVRRTALKR